MSANDDVSTQSWNSITRHVSMGEWKSIMVIQYLEALTASAAAVDWWCSHWFDESANEGREKERLFSMLRKSFKNQSKIISANLQTLHSQ